MNECKISAGSTWTCHLSNHNFDGHCVKGHTCRFTGLPSLKVTIHMESINALVFGHTGANLFLKINWKPSGKAFGC